MWNSKKKPEYEKVKGNLEVDWTLLETLLKLQSPSNTSYEKIFIKWLQDYVEKENPGVLVEFDKIGNTYVTKGKSDIYPCIVAHTDTAQSYNPHLNIINTGTWVIGLDNSTGTQIGTGADDKCGILIALTLLKKYDNIKCFFPVQEEIGLIGSSQADLDFFKDCSFLAQPDRNSYNCDFISETNGIEVCNNKFMDTISTIMTKYGYKEASGTCTDIGALKKSTEVTCPAFNYSCSYFNEHGDQEVINCNAFHNALNFLDEVIAKEGYNEHIHNFKNISYASYGYSFKENYWDDDELPSYLKEKSMIDVEHDCPEFDFNDPEAFEWAKDCLECGECPYCSNNELELMKDTSLFCESCGSAWNIPITSYHDREEWLV